MKNINIILILYFNENNILKKIIYLKKSKYFIITNIYKKI